MLLTLRLAPQAPFAVFSTGASLCTSPSQLARLVCALAVIGVENDTSRQISPRSRRCRAMMPSCVPAAEERGVQLQAPLSKRLID